MGGSHGAPCQLSRLPLEGTVLASRPGPGRCPQPPLPPGQPAAPAPPGQGAQVTGQRLMCTPGPPPQVLAEPFRLGPAAAITVVFAELGVPLDRHRPAERAAVTGDVLVLRAAAAGAPPVCAAYGRRPAGPWHRLTREFPAALAGQWAAFAASGPVCPAAAFTAWLDHERLAARAAAAPRTTGRVTCPAASGPAGVRAAAAGVPAGAPRPGGG